MSRAFRPLVLCYHAVSADWEHALAVRPGTVERHVAALRRRGWRAASAADVAAGTGRLLHVTFDDAYTNIRPTLEALLAQGVPATVFASTGYADEGRPLDVPELAADAARYPEELRTMAWAELAELAGRGVEIGSHTVTHPRLTTLGDAELRRELSASRERVEEQLGRPCAWLAYPYGDEDGRVHEAARAAGYVGAFALPGQETRWHRHALPRVGVYRDDSRARLALKTVAPARRTAAAVLRATGRRA